MLDGNAAAPDDPLSTSSRHSRLRKVSRRKGSLVPLALPISAATEALPCAAAALLPDGTAESLNQRWYAVTGQDASTIASASWAAALHQDDAAYLATMWDRWSLDGQPFEVRLRIRGKGGEHLSFLARAAPVRDPAGMLARWIVTFTAPHDPHFPTAPDGSLGLLAAIVEFADDAVYSKTPDGTIATWNRGAERLFGYTREEAIGRPMQMLVPPDRMDEFEELSRYLERTGSIEHFETMRLHRSGSQVAVSISCSLLRNGNGDVIGTSAIVRNITQQKGVEDEIRRLNMDLEERAAERTRDLEQMNRELEAFSYSVSHDLRAPLRRVEGFARILQDQYGAVLEGEGQIYLDRIRASSQEMTQLIDALLGLARLNRTEVHREAVDLVEIARNILAELSAGAPERNVEFRTVDRLVVSADRHLITILLNNLLENAWKFTRTAPAAVIELGRLEDDPTVLFVRDNGAGFDMRYAGKLFAPFHRLHPASAFEGTGIGLATVQRIVRRHGGMIRAEAAPGKGAAFFFSL